MPTHGTYETVDSRPALRFERHLRHPVDAVWRAVTEPAQLKEWFPTEVEVDLRPGGAMTFTFTEHDLPPMEGEVTALDPPKSFAFSWGGDHLRFELEPADGGAATLLRFTAVLEEKEKSARDAAGWHVCLARLEHLLDGTGETPDWRELYERYEADGLPTGAPIPG